jgi:hypothetical protein
MQLYAFLHSGREKVSRLAEYYLIINNKIQLFVLKDCTRKLKA